MKRIHDGPAELTFADCASVLVPAERVLFTMIDDGEGALWIAPGTMPNMTEIETALESGPFTLTSEGLMQSCKPRRWIVREVTDSLCEMLVLFEPGYGDSDPTRRRRRARVTNTKPNSTERCAQQEVPTSLLSDRTRVIRCLGPYVFDDIGG